MDCLETTKKRLVMRNLRFLLLLPLLLITNDPTFAQQHRKVVINQDCSGPGGSNMQTLLTLIQSPQGGSAGHNRRQRKPMARRRGRAYSATAGANWPHRHSGRAGSRISAGASPSGSPFVAGKVWEGGLCRRLG